MLERSKVIRRVLAINFSIALTAICVSSAPAAQAAYEYSPDSTMPEAGIRVALMDTTTRGDVVVTPKLSDKFEVFRDTLKSCRTRVSSLVAAGESTGILTVAQTDTLRFELDGLNGIEKELNKHAEPQYKRLLQLANHYDIVQARINERMREYKLQMVPTDPAAVSMAGTTISLDLAMKRRAILEDDISSELAKGQMTGKEGARLRHMLNVLAVQERNLRKSGGTLMSTEQTQVDSGLDKVSNALNSSLNL